MANRFLETNYYKSPFVKKLPGQLKSLYSYIICDCTPSGIWCLDLDIAKLFIGFEITIEEFNTYFVYTGKAKEISAGKFFFPDFIEHQYPGGLSDANKAHKNILLELRKFKLINLDNIPIKQAPLEGPLCDPLEGVQGNGQGNGNVSGNGQSQGNTGENIEKMLVPEMLNIFTKRRKAYSPDIERDFKPLQSIAVFIHKQSKLNGNHVENKAVIIKKWEQLCSTIEDDGFYQTKSLSVISNQIQEIYQIEQHGRPKGVKRNNTGTGRHESEGTSGY